MRARAAQMLASKYQPFNSKIPNSLPFRNSGILWRTSLRWAGLIFMTSLRLQPRYGGKPMNSSIVTSANICLCNSQHFCETPWELTWNRFNAGQFRNANRQRMETQCFKSNWLIVALHEGFGFPDTYSHLSAAPETVNGKVVHWTLGALLYRTRFLPLRYVKLSGWCW